MKNTLTFTFLLACSTALAQTVPVKKPAQVATTVITEPEPALPTAYVEDGTEQGIHRRTAIKINDLIHTKLDVRFDYKKRYLYGKEWVTIKPHDHPTDTLRLDAKGMDINNISLVKDGKNVPLKYVYQDSLSLAIHLDKIYQSNENYTIYIDYTSKPNELKAKGSAAINDAKGLYFINPDGTEKDKPIQIWTQGESESASAWFPTIDKPNQKSTDEIIMTVPDKYVTLSNGRLASQKVNNDGTRTDTWKMELPHSPYLFMMAVGDFKIYHDKWRDKPVDYLLEPKYAPYAKDIFGFTPEVIDFYSKTLGIDYPWNKYDQIVVRDYVSGAMENTTATLHGEYVQETKRQLIDSYYDFGRSTIVHELFHQWFGDYVTTESWSNLTVNESFANFSEIIWAEHKYGKDAGDAHLDEDMQSYFRDPANAAKNLVRFNYEDKEDVFDLVTYQKGGCILNMLRTYLGNEVFYKGLNIYLKANAFKNGNAYLLSKALEQASGKNLAWFFNEWYYGAGHPVVNISYKWNSSAKTETVTLIQSQPGNPFILPMAIDIYAGGSKVRHKVWMHDVISTFTFPAATKPDLVNVDAEKSLVMQKSYTQSFDEYAFQYFNAPLYLDRKEAIELAAKHQSDDDGKKVLIAAMKDKYYELRIKAIEALNMNSDQIHDAALPVLTSLAQTDSNTLVRAAAITALGNLKVKSNLPLFKQAMSSQSYAVQGAALTAIAALDPKQAMALAKGLESDNEGLLSNAMIALYIDNGTADQWTFVHEHYKTQPAQGQFDLLRRYAAFAASVTKPEYAQQGVAMLKELGMRFKPYGAAPLVIQLLTDIKDQHAKMGDTATGFAVDQAIKEVNAK